MMMQALEAGGLTPEYKQSREDMKDRLTDEHYNPNVGGLYELEAEDYRDINFPRKYEGKLIKCLLSELSKIDTMPNGIKIVFMRRNVEETRQSFMAFFNKSLEVEHLDEQLDKAIRKLRNRKDVQSVDVFQYRDVVKNPGIHFMILKDNGWPIDIDKAVSVVEPSYMRYKIENLEAGVL